MSTQNIYFNEEIRKISIFLAEKKNTIWSYDMLTDCTGYEE